MSAAKSHQSASRPNPMDSCSSSMPPPKAINIVNKTAPLVRIQSSRAIRDRVKNARPWLSLSLAKTVGASPAGMSEMARMMPSNSQNRMRNIFGAVIGIC